MDRDKYLKAHFASSGGGGCPYVSPWTGTDYELDNNILIASEHQAGIVDDYYVLQKQMVPKNGYYSVRIEEFENSRDFFDLVKLYTIDHHEDYLIGVTPGGEFITYREPEPAIAAYNSDGDGVLGYIGEVGNRSLYMEEGSSVYFNFGEIEESGWEHYKLVVRSYGYESYTRTATMNSGVGLRWLDPPVVKLSLYVSLRIDGSEWVDVVVLHPRNHPSDMVIPLEEVLREFLPGRTGNTPGELEVRILSPGNHYLDFVGIDDSAPTNSVKVREAPLARAILNGEEDVTDTLLQGSGNMVTLIPGDEMTLTFEVPEQSPGAVLSERRYVLFSRGYYLLYEGENDAEDEHNTMRDNAERVLLGPVEASESGAFLQQHVQLRSHLFTPLLSAYQKCPLWYPHLLPAHPDEIGGQSASLRPSFYLSQQSHERDPPPS